VTLATPLLEKNFSGSCRDFPRGGATILRVGCETLLRAKRAENFLVVPPTYAILGGTTESYLTALLQYVTGRARQLVHL